MAQNKVITFVSDISGKDITDNDMPTVSFALDGQAYEIDLTDAEQEKMRKALAPYLDAARKAGSVKKAKTKRTNDGPAAADIRAWAKENGIECPERGRVPVEVKEKFLAAS